MNLKAYYAVLMAPLKIGSTAGENAVLIFPWDLREIAQATMHPRVVGLIRRIDAEGECTAEEEARRRFGAGDFEVQIAQAQRADPDAFPKEINMTAKTAAAPAANSAPNNAKASKATAPEYNPNLPIADIVPDWQNRKAVVEAADLDAELAESIKADGLLQPITVRPCPVFPKVAVLRHVVDKVEMFRVVSDADRAAAFLQDVLLYETGDKRDAERVAFVYRSGDGWQIIAGERRWRASRQIKAETIRAFIHRAESNASALIKQTVENTERLDLNPVQEAKQMKRLSDEGVSQKEIGKRFGGKSQPVVSQMMKLLDFSPDVQRLFAAGLLSPAHVEGLTRFIEWPKACEVIATEWANRGWDAKSLRGDGIPNNLGGRLAQARVAVLIYCGDYAYETRPSYVMPAALQKEHGFFKASYNEWIYMLPVHAGAPNLWEPERAKQDAARVAKAAAEKQKAAAAKKSDKPTKEQLERKKQIEDGKRRRAAVQEGLAKILKKLSTLTQPGVNELAILATEAVAGGYAGKRMQTVADALGIKLPGGVIGGYNGFGAPDKVAKMKAHDIAKLAVGVILHKQADDACKRGYSARALKLYGVEAK